MLSDHIKRDISGFSDRWLLIAACVPVSFSLVLVPFSLAEHLDFYKQKEKEILYSLYLAHSLLKFFNIALKMLGKIASQLSHSENESCLLRTAVMAVHHKLFITLLLVSKQISELAIQTVL